MKKIILLLFIMLFFTPAYCTDYSSYCAQSTYKKTFGGNLSSVFGINTISRNIIESQIQKALKKQTNSKFNVKVNNFYGTNILSGEFKSFNAKSKNCSINNIHASNVEISTICPYNKITYKDDELFFDENMVLKYSAEITQDDIDKMLAEESIQKTIDEMNSNNIVSSLFKIKNYKVTIKNDKLVFKYEILPLGKYDLSKFLKKSPKPIDIIFSAGLKVENNKIKLCDIDFNSLKTSYNSILPLINIANPLNYKINIDKNNNADFKIENIQIAHSKINLDGYIIIPKNN